MPSPSRPIRTVLVDGRLYIAATDVLELADPDRVAQALEAIRGTIAAATAHGLIHDEQPSRRPRLDYRAGAKRRWNPPPR